MTTIGTTKITQSHLHSWAVGMVLGGCTRDKLFSEFKAKGFPVSKRVITQFLREVKGTKKDEKLSKLEEKTLSIVDKLSGQVQDQNLNKVIGVLQRRGPIMNEVDNRIALLKSAQERDSMARVLSLQIQDALNNVTQDRQSDEPLKLRACITLLESALLGIDMDLRKNLPKLGIRADLEGVLQRYLKDKHEYYKYMEEFIAKYEIKTLLEKTAKIIAQAAVEIMLKEIPDDKKINALKAFKEATFLAMKEISKEELDA